MTARNQEKEPLMPPGSKLAGGESSSISNASNSSMVDINSPLRLDPASPATNGGGEAEPEDTYNITYFVLLFLGVALLLTYNSFVAAPDYTGHYYRYAAQNEHVNSTMPHIWHNISPFITAANMVPNLICQIAMLSNYVQSIAVLKRLYFAIILNAVAMLMVPIAPAFKLDEHAALGVLLAGDAICGGATALLQSSAFAIAAQFPMGHMQGTMLGIGVSGTVVSLLQIITFGAIGSSFEAVLKQSSVFFGIGVLALIVLVLILPVLKRNRFARFYILEWKKEDELVASSQSASPASASGAAAAAAVDDVDENDVAPGPLKPSVTAVAREEHHEGDMIYSHVGEKRDGGAILRAQQERGVFNPHEADAEIEAVDVKRVLSICKWNMLANFFVYFVTLFVFPGMGVAVDSSSTWYGIIIIFLFNFGDFSGRMLCKFERFLLSGRHGTLQVFSAARVVFIPLFWLCVKPRLITDKVLPMVLMYLVGITNGFTSSQLMMFTPAMDQLRTHEKPTAGSAMSLSLLGGCCAGSLSALLLSQVYFD